MRGEPSYRVSAIDLATSAVIGADRGGGAWLASSITAALTRELLVTRLKSQIERGPASVSVLYFISITD